VIECGANNISAIPIIQAHIKSAGKMTVINFVGLNLNRNCSWNFWRYISSIQFLGLPLPKFIRLSIKRLASMALNNQSTSIVKMIKAVSNCMPGVEFVFVAIAS